MEEEVVLVVVVVAAAAIVVVVVHLFAVNSSLQKYTIFEQYIELVTSNTKLWYPLLMSGILIQNK